MPSPFNRDPRPSPTPSRIQLVTRDGGHVAWVEVRAYNGPVPIILWNARYFTFRQMSPPYPNYNSYIETDVLVSLTPSPGLPIPPPVPPNHKVR